MIPRLLSLPAQGSCLLFGPRQTGKSTLVDNLFQENVWKVQLLLSEEFLSYSKDPGLFRREAESKLESNPSLTIVVDEIQRVPILLNEVHYLIEKYPDSRFILTGSSARKLRAGGSNLLAGRAIERHIFPFTIKELGDDVDLENVLRYGTLPSIWGKQEELKRDILTTYVHTYLQEEIRSEGIARNIGTFSRFLEIAASQNGECLNFSSISRECTVSSKTIRSYYDILEETLVAVKLEPWTKSLRKRMTAAPRYYFFDTGVTNAINRRLSAQPEPTIRGRLFEQFIVLETHRLLSYAKSEARMYYWRTSNGAEVDLLIEKHGRIIAAIEIKSSYHVSGADCTGLRSFSQEYPETPLQIVCPARNEFSIEGIAVVPWQQYFHKLEHII